jgi:hypothetical protein
VVCTRRGRGVKHIHRSNPDFVFANRLGTRPPPIETQRIHLSQCPAPSRRQGDWDPFSRCDEAAAHRDGCACNLHACFEGPIAGVSPAGPPWPLRSLSMDDTSREPVTGDAICHLVPMKGKKLALTGLRRSPIPGVAHLYFLFFISIRASATCRRRRSTTVTPPPYLSNAPSPWMPLSMPTRIGSRAMPRVHPSCPSPPGSTHRKRNLLKNHKSDFDTKLMHSGVPNSLTCSAHHFMLPSCGINPSATKSRLFPGE